VLDVGQKEFLVLLLVVEPQLDDRRGPRTGFVVRRGLLKRSPA
jgi:hypothetical protein